MDRCTNCNKPMVCESNVWRIRGIMTGCLTRTDTLEAAVLPLLGFNSGEIVAGSTTAAICAGINNIVATSLFTTLQSLDANSCGVILFGSIDSALDILGSLAVKLDWCSGECNNESLLDFETIDGSCDKGCMAKFHLTVTNIHNLKSVRSPDFKLGRIIWSLIVFRNNSNLGIYLHGNKSCEIEMIVQLISTQDNQTNSVERQQVQKIQDHGGLYMNDVILWDELLKPENKYVHNNSIEIEVEIKGETCRGECSKHVEIRPIKLECTICREGIESQEIASVPCGHIYCLECITQSLLEYEQCPECETAASINDLRRIVLPM